MNRILGPNSRICVQAQHAELALVEPELHLRLVHHGPCRLLDMARVDGQTSDVGMGIGVGRLVIQVHSKGGVGVGEDVASGDVGAWASRARRSDRRWRARRPHGLRSRLGGCLAPGEVLIGDLESARSSAVVGSGIGTVVGGRRRSSAVVGSRIGTVVGGRRRSSAMESARESASEKQRSVNKQQCHVTKLKTNSPCRT